MDKFEIRIKSDSNIFSSGETVHGYVFVVLKDAIKARSIRVTISGKAKTKWDYYNPATKVYISCQGEDSYINQELVLWNGRDNKKTEDQLKAGIHEFPFNFVIPERCPPSFEGDHGKIRYFCKAEIDRPWRLDSKAEIKIIVRPQLDLNRIGGLGRRSSRVDDNLGAMFFKHGKVDVMLDDGLCESYEFGLENEPSMSFFWIYQKVTLPKSGFIIGESMTPTIAITNLSNRTVQKIDVALVQFVTFTAKHGGVFKCETGSGEISRCHTSKRAHKNIVEHKNDLKILPHNSASHNTSIIVPDVPISFNTSPIIKIEYFLKVTIVADGLVANSVSVEIPIVIGTVPIEDNPTTVTTTSNFADPPPPYEEIRQMSIG